MTSLRQLTIEEVTGILARGAFDEIVSTVEHVQLECKAGFYDIKTVKGKIELAKDISALANSSGGYLLIGPATKKNPLHQGDEVVFKWCSLMRRKSSGLGSGVDCWRRIPISDLGSVHLR